ncbi:hypothetical protein Bca52824_053474 [Brassica carinata]|uniref:mRNA (guanine-N(7))-methyltransferase n=1 Tax=Brassica carinata TaxID=52824 RepID=A0A8X7UKY6_BRACI|nr:hypothetical protein Bca52824_053474 [Brassica carinata]
MSGGDLIKWDKARIGFYVGIDIAEGSIEDCRTRYNGDADQHQRRKKFSFSPVYYVELDKILEEDAPIVICSCQVLNVSFSCVFIGTTPDANVIIKKLRQAEGLEIANSVYWIRFGEWFSQKKFKSSSPFGIEYVFHLEDAVDCPEWIYDLELVFVKNSHEFVHEYMKKTEFVELMRRLGALGDGNQDQSTLSTDEWDTAYLYLSFVLRKRGGESDGGQRIGERRKNG